MNQTYCSLIIKSTTIFFIFSVFLATLATTSQAFIMCKKLEHTDDTSKQDKSEPKRREHDTSCVSEELSKILQLSLNEIPPTLNNMTIERQVETYLCSCQAGLNITEELLIILSKRLQTNLEYLTSCLKKEHEDLRIADLLAIFLLHGIEEVEKVFSIKRDYLTVEELPFSPEVTRFLISKAEEITKESAREFFLDYLIAFLPREESVARQAKREEAQKKAGK